MWLLLNGQHPNNCFDGRANKQLGCVYSVCLSEQEEGVRRTVNVACGVKVEVVHESIGLPPILTE